jgi:polyisoprenoid-binding protein YceI
MRSIVLAVTLLAGLPVASAQPAAAKLLAPQSEVAFTTRQMGVPVDGRFKRFDAQLQFDPKKPDGGSVAMTVDVASVSLGVPEVDSELPKPTWFNVVKFPQARFQSSAIRALGGGRFEIAGKLNVKGHDCEVLVPIAITQAGPHSTVNGSFMIKRLDFKIGEAEWADTTVVANDVKVSFRLVFSGLGAL